MLPFLAPQRYLSFFYRFPSHLYWLLLLFTFTLSFLSVINSGVIRSHVLQLASTSSGTGQQGMLGCSKIGRGFVSSASRSVLDTLLF